MVLINRVTSGLLVSPFLLSHNIQEGLVYLYKMVLYILSAKKNIQKGPVYLYKMVLYIPSIKKIYRRVLCICIRQSCIFHLQRKYTGGSCIFCIKRSCILVKDGPVYSVYKENIQEGPVYLYKMVLCILSIKEKYTGKFCTFCTRWSWLFVVYFKSKYNNIEILKHLFHCKDNTILFLFLRQWHDFFFN